MGFAGRMSGLSYQRITDALAQTPLFEDKTWQLSPEPWHLSPKQVEQIEAIGQACLDFYRALDSLYLRATEGKNLLRNKELKAPWVVEYLDRGKPRRLIEHGRNRRMKGAVPVVIRPDLLITEDGFALTEMDSVPGGLGLTAFLNGLYTESPNFADKLLGGSGEQVALDWYQALVSQLRPAQGGQSAAQSGQGAASEAQANAQTSATVQVTAAASSFARGNADNPVIAVIVSDEADVYRPEFEYLSTLLRERHGLRVYTRHPDDIMPLGDSLCIPVDGNPLKVDLIYRFWELFDLGNVSTAQDILHAVEEGEVVVSPPMKAYQEEKLNLALLHHHALADYWQENLPKRSLKVLKQIVPESWIMDAAPLPPCAVLDAPWLGGKPIRDWRELAGASQKERGLIIKASGFHETAWGARSVTLGSDSSREDWQAAIDEAIAMAPETLHILQRYHKPVREQHPIYDESGTPHVRDGRVRLCPYYFAHGEKAKLSAVLATFCPADKKIIHGMKDAAMLPSMVFDA